MVSILIELIIILRLFVYINRNSKLLKHDMKPSCNSIYLQKLLALKKLDNNIDTVLEINFENHSLKGRIE